MSLSSLLIEASEARSRNRVIQVVKRSWLSWYEERARYNSWAVHMLTIEGQISMPLDALMVDA